MMLSIATSQPQQHAHPIKVTNTEGETVQILTTDGHGNLISGGNYLLRLDHSDGLHTTVRSPTK